MPVRSRLTRDQRDPEHDAGFYVSGPVKLPWVNKKVPGIWSDRSKAYFYINYEAFRIVGGVNVPTITLPSAKMKQGDFSEWKDADGNLIPVYDPATIRNNPSLIPQTGKRNQLALLEEPVHGV